MWVYMTMVFLSFFAPIFMELKKRQIDESYPVRNTLGRSISQWWNPLRLFVSSFLESASGKEVEKCTSQRLTL